jgi:DNA uptake protein ComE-like DNA-binding protein
MRDFLRQFLLYSRSERRAVVALVILIAIVVIIPRVYHFYIVKVDTIHVDTHQHIQDRSDSIDDKIITTVDSTSHDSLFYFDPNTITEADWIKLGLTEKQAAVIEKYKSKGGRFHTSEDIRKLYVLSDDTKDRLVPYVRISGSDNGDDHKPVKGAYSIEINAADSAAFESLHGIGPSLASRIVRFRRILGGFYQVEQLKETYGLSDSTFRLIRPHLTVNPALVVKMDINQADYETLRRHPYIHARIAHVIIGYRERSGRFESLEQLRALKSVTDMDFNKIKPYLTVGQ